jgi:hypothetical protein
VPIILGKQDVPRTDEEVFSFTRLEIQRSTQRDHQLRDGGGMPGEGTAGSRFLKGDALGRHSAAQHVTTLAGLKVDDALLEMRVPVVSGP